MKNYEQKEEIFLIIVVVVTVILVFTMNGKTKAIDIVNTPEDDDDDATDRNLTEDDDNDATDTNISEEDDNDTTDSNTSEKNDKDDTNANTTDKWDYNWLLLLIPIACIFILIILYRKRKTSLKSLTQQNLMKFNKLKNQNDNESYDSIKSSSVKTNPQIQQYLENAEASPEHKKYAKYLFESYKNEKTGKLRKDVQKKAKQYTHKYKGIQNLNDIPVPQNKGDKIIHQLAIDFIKRSGDKNMN